MKLSNMSDDQLLEQTGTIEGFDEDLNEEWEARHDMNIPYYLTGRDTMVVVNALTDTVVPDELCDKLILEQAEELRIRRATTTPPVPYIDGTLQNRYEDPIIYRHYKGTLYQYLGIAKDSDTLERVVVYMDVSKSTVWTRPEEEFFDVTVDKHTGHYVKRFKRIPYTEENGYDKV